MYPRVISQLPSKATTAVIKSANHYCLRACSWALHARAKQ